MILPTKEEVVSGPTKQIDKDATDLDKVITYEEPEVIDKSNVIYWCEHYKRLEGVEDGNAIRTKARKFLQYDCIGYDKEKKCYVCKPIPGYNSTTYHIVSQAGEFHCSCQYHVTTKKMCSHILGLYMQLKIWNWARRKEKQDSIKIEKMYAEAGIENPLKND